jgi:hypothetical protein
MAMTTNNSTNVNARRILRTIIKSPRKNDRYKNGLIRLCLNAAQMQQPKAISKMTPRAKDATIPPSSRQIFA